MTAPNMLRVRPHEKIGALPVPLEDGTRLTRDMAGTHGHLLPDSVYVRRRIAAQELELLAEGAAALPATIEAKERAAQKATAPAPTVSASASVKGAA